MKNEKTGKMTGQSARKNASRTSRISLTRIRGDLGKHLRKARHSMFSKKPRSRLRTESDF